MPENEQLRHRGSVEGWASASRSGSLPLVGRVFVDPETEGPHFGYRGPIRCDDLGVHTNYDCEVLIVLPDLSSEWGPVERECLLPWHRVHVIEWDTEDDHGD